MIYFSKIGLLLILSTFVLNSCKKKHECEDDVPVIEFEDFTIKGANFGTLLLKFVDCDGDIGLSQADSTGDHKFNMFIDYYEKQNGEWIKPELALEFNYRIPVHSDKGDFVEGEIELSNVLFNTFSQYDTIRYEIFIKDYALNESNRVVSREIIIPHN